MLSNIEIILLRIIKDNPAYAYELEKKIEKKKIRTWVKIGGTTVYQVLDRLCKQGLLAFKLEKEGNMPERRRYYLTPLGEERLVVSLKEKLRHPEPYYFDLNVGLACRHLLDEEEFKATIRERLAELNAFIENFHENFEKAKELYPSKRLLVKEYLLSHYKLEQEFLQKLLG